MFFKQIKHRGDNFSYIIADDTSKEAAVIDPSFNADAIIRILRDQKLKAKYIINTHSHLDHTAENEVLKTASGARIVAYKLAVKDDDVSVDDGDNLNIGGTTIHVIHTSGHTPDSICLLIDGKLLTGDTLFVGECGRTDLPGGDSEAMYDSLFNKLMKLADDVEVYPGHDYGPRPNSTIGSERRTNYVLQQRCLDEFIQFMGTP